MTLIRNLEGNLHVSHQVEDYVFHGNEFEGMGFLTFMVETYEHQMPTGDSNIETDNNNELDQVINQSGHYLSNHSKSMTHI